MFLYIPLILSILCGILNPYGGPLGVIATTFGMLLLFFMEKSIKKDIHRMKESKQDNGAVIVGLIVSNWLMTAFAFLMMNIVTNIFLFYVCNVSITVSGNAPLYGGIQIFADNINICYLLFVLNVLFHVIGTIMIFIKGNSLRKSFTEPIKEENEKVKDEKVPENEKENATVNDENTTKELNDDSKLSEPIESTEVENEEELDM